MEVPKPLAVRLQDFSRIVHRTVVDDNHFIISISLRENALDRFDEEGSTIKGWDDYRNYRSHSFRTCMLPADNLEEQSDRRRCDCSMSAFCKNGKLHVRLRLRLRCRRIFDLALFAIPSSSGTTIGLYPLRFMKSSGSF